MWCLQIRALQTDLAAASSRAETAEQQQQAAATAATLALSRAQQELEEAQSAQFVAEEAYRTADAAAKLLAQKITGQHTILWHGVVQTRAALHDRRQSSLPCACIIPRLQLTAVTSCCVRACRDPA